MKIKFLFLLSLSFFSLVAAQGSSLIGKRQINVHGNKILVDGKPFFIKGVCYSPAPIGDNPVYESPYGDYYTKEYHHLWERDFPLLKEMGANTIRVYGWDVHGIHDDFLDAAYNAGLMVIVTYYLGTAVENPVGRDEERARIMNDFLWQVNRYKGHPALLGWAFGNELNGDWNHFLQAFSDAYNCNWNSHLFPGDPNGCYYNPDTTGACGIATECVYSHFFGFLDAVAYQAHEKMLPYNHLLFTSLADVDRVVQRIQLFERYAPNFDVWAVHLYRGDNFGVGEDDFFAAYEGVSKKPLIVTEYGVDAYRDPCGSSDATPCFNTVSDPPPGFGEDQKTHAEWNIKLTNDLLSHSSADNRGSVAGGFMMAWIDEWWKGAVNVKGCKTRWGEPNFQSSDCEWKAHADCPAKNVTDHTLCGYWLGAPFDHYVNEAWFGIMQVSNEGGVVDKLIPRELYVQLKELWSGPPSSAWTALTISVVTVGAILAVLIFAAVFYFRHRKQRPTARRPPQNLEEKERKKIRNNAHEDTPLLVKSD